jgi:hypothetical protein
MKLMKRLRQDSRPRYLPNMKQESWPIHCDIRHAYIYTYPSSGLSSVQKSLVLVLDNLPSQISNFLLFPCSFVLFTESPRPLYPWQGASCIVFFGSQ